MSRLSGEQAARLSAALREAFSHDDFAQLLYFALDKRLEDITLGASFEARVFDVIRKAEREGWIPRLIDAASAARPADVALARIRDELAAGHVGSAGVPGRAEGSRDATAFKDGAGSGGTPGSPAAPGSGAAWQPGTGLGELLFQVRLRGARGQLALGFGSGGSASGDSGPGGSGPGGFGSGGSGPGDTVVVVDRDAVVYRWRIGDQAELAPVRSGEPLRDGIHVAMSTTQPAIAFARPGTLTVARLDDGKYRVASRLPLARYEFIVPVSGERFATYDGRRVAVRDFGDGAVLWEQPCPSSLATTAVDATGTVVATADGRLGANGSKVTVGTRDKTRLHEFTLANVPMVGLGCVLGLSPGGELLAAASLREIVLVRPRTGEVAFRRPLRGFRQEMAPALGTRPQLLVPVPDGTAPDGTVLWLRGRRVAVIRRADDELHYLPQDGDIDDIAFDYARSRLATVNSDGLVSVWHWRLTRPRWPWPGHWRLTRPRWPWPGHWRINASSRWPMTVNDLAFRAVCGGGAVGMQDQPPLPPVYANVMVKLT